MSPMAIRNRRKGLQVVHRCTSCGKIQSNRIAADTDQPDDMTVILALMTRGN